MLRRNIQAAVLVCAAVLFLFAGSLFAEDRISIGLVMSSSGQTGYDLSAVSKCLSQVLQKHPVYYGRVLEKVEKTDRMSLQQAGKKAGVEHVVLVELRAGKDAPLAMVQKVDVKTFRSDVVSYPLNGPFGRACDAAFFGITQFFSVASSKEAHSFIDLGNQALEKGETELAIGRYSQAMQADPSSPTPPRLIGRTYGKAGQTTEALQWYAEALNRRSADLWSYMEAANLASESGDGEQALRYYEYAVSAGSRVPMLYKLEGRFDLQLGRYSLAAENFLTVLDLDPQDTGVYPMLVDSFAGDERYDEAAKYQAILNGKKPTAEGLRNLAYYYEQAQKYGDAVPILQQLVKQSPEQLDFRWRLGFALESNGRIEEAVAVYSQLLTARPDDERVPKAIGRIFYRQRKYADAIRMFRAARSIDPSDTETLRLEGMALELTNDVDGALAVYSQALRIDQTVQPSDVARYLALAKKNNRMEEAVDTLRSMLPEKNQDARRTMVMGMGERLTLDGKIEEAIRLYDSSIDAMGMFAPPLMALGDLYLKTGDYDNAFRTYMRAVMGFGEAAIPFYAEQKFYETGQLEYAHRMFDAAYGRDSDNVVTALALAEIVLLQDGDLDLDSVYLSQAFTLPKNEMQREKLQFLMIMWGLRSGKSDYADKMLKFALQEIPSHPEIRPDLSVFKSWIESRFEGNARVLARDIAALFSRQMSVPDFKAAHP